MAALDFEAAAALVAASSQVKASPHAQFAFGYHFGNLPACGSNKASSTKLEPVIA